MAMPKTVTSVTRRNGVTFVSSVDRAQYTIKELTKAALRDVKKLILKKAKEMIPEKTGTLKKATGGWVKNDRKTGEVSLYIGVYTNKKANEKGLTPAYHAHLVQFGYTHIGGKRVPPVKYLDQPVYDYINDIIRIEAQYLSAIEDEARAMGLIDESEDEA